MADKRGGKRTGAGRRRKWASESDRKRSARFEKRTQAFLLVGKVRGLLLDLLDENPAAFDYWAWLHYYARYPEERPLGVAPRRAQQLLRKHPLSRVDEWAVVEAALSMDLLPWQSDPPWWQSKPVSADWAPYVDLLPWAPKKFSAAGGWQAPAYSAEYVDEIGPRVIDGVQVFSYDDTLSKPEKGES